MNPYRQTAADLDNPKPATSTTETVANIALALFMATGIAAGLVYGWSL